MPEHKTFFKSEGKSRVELARERQAAEDHQWRECCKAVDHRDKRTCRACGRKSNPEAIGLTKRGHRHHLVLRSAGGEDVPSNVVTLCFSCHDDVHVKRTLQVEGDANEALAFWRRDFADTGEFYLWRREVAVGRFEHD